jgi:hypothetical protein
MADDVLASFLVALGFKVDQASKSVATKSVADYEKAVVEAEKRIEDARWAGAKTEEEIAKLTRETNLRLAKEALQRAKDEEKQRAETAKKQEEALKAGKQRIADFAKSAMAIGAAIEVAALGVHAAVVRMAQSFDTLHFTSQRTGASVRSIQAIGYAASQMGSSAEAGIASLENFSRTLRQSPGSYSLLERLGIKTTDAKGARRAVDELYQEFGKALKDKPGYLQDQYLQDFGVDEKTGRALIQGLDKFTAEYNEKLKKTGLDPDKAAQDASGLQRTFGSLAASIAIIGQKVASNLFSGENNAFQKFIEFLDAHGNEIAEVISHIAQVVLELARALIELVTSPEAKKWLDTMLLAFGDIDKETGRFTANVDKMKVALGLFGAFVATTWLSKVLGAFGIFGTGWKGLLGILGLGAGATGALAVGTAIGADASVPNGLKPGASDQWDEDHAGAAPGGALGAAGRLARRAYGAVKRVFTGGDAEAGGGAAPPRGDGRGSPGAARTADMMRYAMDQLRREGVPEDKVRAAAAHLVGQAKMESGLDPNKTHDPDASGRPTGYGIYGARLDRRDKMLAWLKANGYAPNSAEGQMRYMAREAMNDKAYSQTRRILMGEGSGDVDNDTNTITKNFENPKIVNRRSGAVREALAIGPSEAPTGGTAVKPGEDPNFFPNGAPRVLKPSSMKDSPGLTAAEAARRNAAIKPATMKDILPRGMEGVFNGGLPNFSMPQAPSAGVDGARTTNITIKQGDTNVTGVSEPKRAAEHVGAIMGYRNSDLVRNIRPSLA